MWAWPTGIRLHNTSPLPQASLDLAKLQAPQHSISLLHQILAHHLMLLIIAYLCYIHIPQAALICKAWRNAWTIGVLWCQHHVHLCFQAMISDQLQLDPKIVADYMSIDPF